MNMEHVINIQTRDIKQHAVDMIMSTSQPIVLLDLQECELDTKQHANLIDFIQCLLSDSRKVKLITCNGGKSHFDIFEGLEVVNWPYAFFILARANMHNMQPSSANMFEKHFICMNHRPKHSRAHLLDMIFANKLNGYGNISWRYSCQADTLYFKPCNVFDTRATIMLDFKDQDEIGYTDLFNVPTQYDKSAVDIVTESIYDIRGHDNVFVTEKTVKPLLLGKLFLCLALPGHHTWLEQQGFKLYHEIFNYNFDTEHDPIKRADMFYKNIEAICNIDIDKFNKIYIDLEEKIAHNRQLALTIAPELPYISNSVTQSYIFESK